MASAIPFIRSVALLSFLLALSSGGGGRELAPRVEVGLAHQVKSQNRHGYKIPNAARLTSNIRPNVVAGNKILQYAVMRSGISEYHGAKATFSVHSLPQVESDQSSAVVLWVSHSDGDGVNSAQVGWHVRPDLYGDTRTHIFVGWTVDNAQKTGCFDLQCRGFVLLDDSPVTPGQVFGFPSAYGGEQSYITLSIHQEPEGDWWFSFGEGTEATIPVGYWPKSLFTTLGEKANTITVGGIVGYERGTQGPPMGSGHPSSEGANKAAFIGNIEFMDNHREHHHVMPGTFSSYVTCKDFYDLTEGHDTATGGLEFYYGGPQGCTSQ